MGDFRRFAKYWNREVRPHLVRVSDLINRQNSDEDVRQQQQQQQPEAVPPILERPVELDPSQSAHLPIPLDISDGCHEVVDHQEADPNTPEDPVLPATLTPSLPPPPLTFQELLERGGLTAYHRFQMNEFNDAATTGLGEGGQAHVYLQVHHIFGAVAVKMFYSNSPIRHKEREIKNIMKLQGHPGVIRLFGLVYNREETEIIGYVMEHVALSMADVIFSENPSGEWTYEYSVAQAVRWIIDTAACMSYLHQEEILHRDLKPHNILIVWNHQDKPIRICDLGFSKDVFLSRGRPSNNVGTPLYRPPEMMLSRQTEDESEKQKAGDVYSLAITIWELLHRQKEPSLGRNEIEIFANIGQGMRPAIDSSCPEKLAEIIRSCWARDVKGRPTMKELKKKLEDLLAQKEEWEELIVNGTDEKSVEKCEF